MSFITIRTANVTSADRPIDRADSVDAHITVPSPHSAAVSANFHQTVTARHDERCVVA